MGFLGSRGPQGFTGSSGFLGSRGPQGFTGSAGFSGSGFTGSLGFAGSAGFTGSSAGGSITVTTDSSANTFNPVFAFAGSISPKIATTLTFVPSTGVLTASELRATGEITAFYSSDERLKENITPIANPIESIAQLRGVRFDWTDLYIGSRGGEDGVYTRKHDVGVIAQEVQKVLPELVVERNDGFLAVRYEKIVALLIEAINDQQKQIEELRADVNRLKG